MRVVIDDAVTLRFRHRRGAEATLRIDGDILLREAGSDALRLSVDEAPAELGPVLNLLDKCVDRAHLDDRGALSVAFIGGTDLMIPSSPAFATWEFWGEGTHAIGLAEGNVVMGSAT